MREIRARRTGGSVRLGSYNLTNLGRRPEVRHHAGRSALDQRGRQVLLRSAPGPCQEADSLVVATPGTQPLRHMALRSQEDSGCIGGRDSEALVAASRAASPTVCGREVRCTLMPVLGAEALICCRPPGAARQGIEYVLITGADGRARSTRVMGTVVPSGPLPGKVTTQRAGEPSRRQAATSAAVRGWAPRERTLKVSWKPPKRVRRCQT